MCHVAFEHSKTKKCLRMRDPPKAKEPHTLMLSLSLSHALLPLSLFLALPSLGCFCHSFFAALREEHASESRLQSPKCLETSIDCRNVHQNSIWVLHRAPILDPSSLRSQNQYPYLERFTGPNPLKGSDCASYILLGLSQAASCESP